MNTIFQKCKPSFLTPQTKQHKAMTTFQKMMNELKVIHAALVLSQEDGRSGATLHFTRVDIKRISKIVSELTPKTKP